MDAFFLMIAFRFILETTCPLTFVVDLWLSLAGSISAIARLTLTNCAILFYLLNMWLIMAGGISVLARLILLFYFTQPVAATGRRNLRHRPAELFFIFFISLRWHHVARLTLLYLTELLCGYFMLMYTLWTNVCCFLVVGIVVERN